MIKLTPEQQAVWCKDEPGMFEPVPGGWGRGGATLVKLKPATKIILKRAMQDAWNNVTAPKKRSR